MDWFINNWYIAIGLIAILVAMVFSVARFLKLPKPDQIVKIKEWLLYACIEAEKNLGDGTGKVKLRYVYDKFVTKFPLVDKLISFETFSSWVDDALKEMRTLLDTNEAVENIVKG